MYIPEKFKMPNEEMAFEVMKKYSFATLVTSDQGHHYATHVPVITDQENRELLIHISKNNPQWTSIEKGEVLVIFQGPHSYISPSVYETDQQAATYNYIVVHVYGKAHIFNDQEEHYKLLSILTKQFESPDSGYGIEVMPKAEVMEEAQGIVYFKVAIERIEGAWKLSQHHPLERKERVIRDLHRQGKHDLAEWMTRAVHEKHRND